ncbi:MAG TPA: hypothetical protein VF944_05110 [Candidatus Bathyarchaeia archaeon]
MSETPPPAGHKVEDFTEDKPKLPLDEEPAIVGERDRDFRRKISSRQEWVRTGLALGAFLALVGVLTFLVASVYGEITVDNIEKVATVIVTPLTAIVGTIVGFYFAERRDGTR